MSKPNVYELNSELADLLTELRATENKSSHQLAAIAADVRSQYLVGKTYDPKFDDFWRDFKMNERFGEKANFTRYAGAGLAPHRIAVLQPLKSSDLPLSIAARYEISQLTDEELKLCLENTYSRNKGDTDFSMWKKIDPPSPLICATSTAPQIRTWRKRWRNPPELTEHCVERAEHLAPDVAEAVTLSIRQAMEPLEEIALDRDINIDMIVAEFRRQVASSYQQPAVSDGAIAVWLERRMRYKYKIQTRRKSSNLPFAAKSIAEKLGFEVTLAAEAAQARRRSGSTKSLATPDADELLVRLAEEYLRRFGPRKLIALHYRCEGKGVWGEKAIHPMTKKLALKLESQMALALKSVRGEIPEIPPAKGQKKIDELTSMLPPSIAEAPESELEEYAYRLIHEFLTPFRARNAPVGPSGDQH